MEEDKFYDRLGQRIMEIRVNKSVKQEALGEYLGLSRSSITNIEKGRQKPSLFILRKICVYFDINLDTIVPELESKQQISTNSRVVTQDFDIDFINKNESLHKFFELTK